VIAHDLNLSFQEFDRTLFADVGDVPAGVRAVAGNEVFILPSASSVVREDKDDLAAGAVGTV